MELNNITKILRDCLKEDSDPCIKFENVFPMKPSKNNKPSSSYLYFQRTTDVKTDKCQNRATVRMFLHENIKKDMDSDDCIGNLEELWCTFDYIDRLLKCKLTVQREFDTINLQFANAFEDQCWDNYIVADYFIYYPKSYGNNLHC